MEIKKVDNLLNEMAYSRSYVVDKCAELGKEFVEHFHKVMHEGIDSDSFKHHCSEMQTWWNTVRSMSYKHNKKRVPKSDLFDMFLTVGDSIEFLIEESYQEAYEEFCIYLLYDYSHTVEEAFKQIF